MALQDPMNLIRQPDETARLNAQIGGLRKRLNERKAVIAEYCLEKCRSGGAVDQEIAAGCREAVELEDTIQALLEQLQHLRDQQAGYAEPAHPAVDRKLPPLPPPVPSAPMFTEPTGAVPPVPASNPTLPPPPAATPTPPPPPAIPLPSPAAPPVAAPAAPEPSAPVRTEAAPADSDAEMISCAACGVKNAKGTKFCLECGMKLQSTDIQCSVCSTMNPGGTRFCIYCGARLEDAPAPAPAPAPPPPPAKLFCPECGIVNEPGTKFCGDCGARM